MKLRIIALLLAFAMMLSISACKSADDEDEAIAGNVTSGNNEDDSANDDSSSDDSSSDDSSSDNSPSDDSSSDDSSSDNTAPGGNDNTSDDTEDDKKPPLSSEGKYTITFDYGYDNKIEIEKTNGSVTKITPKRDGYEFEGWTQSGSEFDFSRLVSGNITLKANWKIITYTITYKAPGATLPSGNPTTYTVESGVNSFKAPTRAYRIFKGWAIENSANSTSSTLDGIAKGTTGNLTMVAIWDEENIVLGSYEQDGNSSNGKEPIEWIKLKEENGKGYFMAKYVLEGKAYQEPKKSVTWAICTLRTWLNGTFYNTAFSSADKALVLESDIHTPKNDQLNKGVAVDTKDRVFLMSLQEAETLTTWQQRKAGVTEYAVSQGCIKSDDGTADWWLRTVGHYDDYAALVQENSGIREGGYSCDMKTIGVRPCIWVDMSKLG